MTEISGVAEAVLYVDDLDRATAFYTRVLGLPL
ncbi:MAG: VOC family protein, partial [Chloroflexota bacterium]